MSSIPADTLKAILELRSENGLVDTEEAVYADLAKAKWVLEETPRYRKAGRSPLYLSGKYLSSYGTDPATGERDGKADAASGKSLAVERLLASVAGRLRQRLMKPRFTRPFTVRAFR